MIAGVSKSSSGCNFHFVFATIDSQIVAARLEGPGPAGKDEESKKETQAESSEVIVAEPTIK